MFEKFTNAQDSAVARESEGASEGKVLRVIKQVAHSKLARSSCRNKRKPISRSQCEDKLCAATVATLNPSPFPIMMESPGFAFEALSFT